MSKQSSVDEAVGEEQLMLDVLRAQMDSEGVSKKLKSQIRISILRMLGHSVTQCEGSEDGKPAPPKDLAVINSLIKEYLEWVGYTYSSMSITSGKAKEREKNANCACANFRVNAKNYTLREELHIYGKRQLFPSYGKNAFVVRGVNIALRKESSSSSCLPELSRSEMQSILNLEAIGKQNTNLPLLYILVEQLKKGQRN